MNAADYIVEELIKYGVTDTFGVPGGVILKLLYAMQKYVPKLTPHLNYHEQMAGFAACGYAQASGKLGVAYATRGPGITNMVTCIAEAYQESLPVLFLTAHGARIKSNRRFENEQELDIVKGVSDFAKYAVNIETVEEVPEKFHRACQIALSGRKGPVLLDFSTKIFAKEIVGTFEYYVAAPVFIQECEDQSEIAIEAIKEELKKSKRPIILIGNGLRYSALNERLAMLADTLNIPILSSRASQDLCAGSVNYFGYIGSHGTRYSNFILSKADLLIVIGNRLGFPIDSESYSPVVKNKKIIRLDIDQTEFNEGLPNSENYIVDARILIKKFIDKGMKSNNYSEWLEVCSECKNQLDTYDIPEVVDKLEKFLIEQNKEKLYVCDVGNNEFWFARAYEYIRPGGNVLYSIAYGTLGTALGRAIGAYYATKKDIICIIGDQGFQYNIQELQYISTWSLPIKIVLLNNAASGMIKDHEEKLFGNELVHVDIETGYSTPDFEKIVHGYGVFYTKDETIAVDESKKQLVYEINFDKNILLTPILPKGNVCQDMSPLINRDKYNYLDQL